MICGNTPMNNTTFLLLEHRIFFSSRGSKSNEIYSDNEHNNIMCIPCL